MARIHVSAAVLSLLALAGSAHGATYFDGVFNGADWALATVTNAAGVGSGGVGFQVPAGGNPNEYRRIQHSLIVGPPLNGAIFTFHININANYNPSTQGAITSIDYSEDSINFTPDTIVPGAGQAAGLLIIQNGKYYRQQSPFFVMPYSGFSNWAPNIATGLLAADFAEVTNTGIIMISSNPDFSAAGTNMQLGFWRGNSGNGGYNTDCGIDNWRVTIVPAPGAAALLGLSGLMVAGGRRRRA
jgi:hypothetical protein